MWLIALKKCRDVSAKITVSVKSATRNSRKYFDKIGHNCDPTRMQQGWGNLVHGIEGRLVYKR